MICLNKKSFKGRSAPAEFPARGARWRQPFWPLPLGCTRPPPVWNMFSPGRRKHPFFVYGFIRSIESNPDVHGIITASDRGEMPAIFRQRHIHDRPSGTFVIAEGGSPATRWTDSRGRISRWVSSEEGAFTITRFFGCSHLANCGKLHVESAVADHVQRVDGIRQGRAKLPGIQIRGTRQIPPCTRLFPPSQ